MAIHELYALSELDPKLARDLTNRGLVYLTEAGTIAGSIIASSWEHAEKIAAQRCMGEVVVGQLIDYGDSEIGHA